VAYSQICPESQISDLMDDSKASPIQGAILPTLSALPALLELSSSQANQRQTNSLQCAKSLKKALTTTSKLIIKTGCRKGDHQYVAHRLQNHYSKPLFRKKKKEKRNGLTR
jgi:hypothetical protein